MEDWLEAGQAEPTPEQRDRGMELARLYYAAFVENAAGAEILKLWEETIRVQRVPVDAPIQRYAQIEGVRTFVYGIGNQIAMAKRGSQRP